MALYKFCIIIIIIIIIIIKTDWLGFNGTFSTNRLYRAFEKYVAGKKARKRSGPFLTMHTKERQIN